MTDGVFSARFPKPPVKPFTPPAHASGDRQGQCLCFSEPGTAQAASPYLGKSVQVKERLRQFRTGYSRLHTLLPRSPRPVADMPQMLLGRAKLVICRMEHLQLSN